MALTRRQFLKRSGLIGGGLVAGGMAGRGVFGNSFVRKAMAETIGDRYFVIIYLDGGNDGLNTVTATDNGTGTLRTDYEGWRRPFSINDQGGIQLLVPELTPTVIGDDPNTGATLALHPGFAGFAGFSGDGGIHALHTAGKVATIQGCGYPDWSLSHDVSTTIWETANPLGTPALAGAGWAGRYLEDPSTAYGLTDIPGVAINSSVPGDLQQNGTSVLAIRQLRRFGFPYDFIDNNSPLNNTPIEDILEDDVAAKRAAFLGMYAEAQASGQVFLEQIGGAGESTLEASELYPPLHEHYENDRSTFDAMYDNLPRRGVARDLREVAKLIYGIESGALPAPGVGEPDHRPRHFWVRNGGYDTHSDQGGADPNDSSHFELHAEVAAAVKIFYDDLDDMGAADKLCIMIWSEFSRRVQQNKTGTDHGSQGPMFVIGGKVNGGVYGNHPNIDPGAVTPGKPENANTIYSQDPLNGYRSTDFRDVYGTILKHWLNMPHGTILSNVLPLDSGMPVNDYWTLENFDLTHPVNGNPLFLP